MTTHDYDMAALKEAAGLREAMMKRIAQNLRKIRKQKGLTQEQVAERAGNLSVKYLGELERGIKKPSAVVIHRLAKALSEPVCALISNADCPYGHDGLPQRIAKLTAGKPERDCKKAMRIVEIILG